MSWFSGATPGYQRTPTTMPGGFPQEDVLPAERNRFNSHAISRYLGKAAEVVQIVVVKALIFVLYIVATTLGKAVQLVYVRELSKPAQSGSIDRAGSFIRQLEDSLPPGDNEARLPPFFQGSYTQALYNATNKGVFLFVYLTNMENENSWAIFHSIVTHPRFVSIFDDPNVMIWGGDLTNPECYQLANGLNATKFPFLGLLGLTRSTIMSPSGPVKTKPKMSLLVKLQGGLGKDVDAEQVISSKFLKKLAKYEPELKAIRAELKDKFIIAVLMKQQQLSFESSLAKDRIKKQKKEKEKLLKEYLVYRLGYFKQLNLDEVPSSQKARIGIKLPTGERATMVFPGDSTVQDIFVYVQLLREGYFDRTVETAVSEQEQHEKFRDFHPDFKFKITSPLPPKVVLNEYLSTPIRDLRCVFPNGMVIVEDDE